MRGTWAHLVGSGMAAIARREIVVQIPSIAAASANFARHAPTATDDPFVACCSLVLGWNRLEKFLLNKR